MEDVDTVAKNMYDFACANRQDNLNKDGSAGDPRKVGCEYESLFENAKNFYRNLAKWHLTNK
jgi:hypothetical protein